MKITSAVPVFLVASIVISGCQKSEPTIESPPDSTPPAAVTQNEPNHEIDVMLVDPRFTALVVGTVFFVTEEDAKKYNIDETKAAAELKKINPDEMQKQLKHLRSSGKGDEQIAAAKLLAENESERAAYKDLLLKVPSQFGKNSMAYSQSLESWGELMHQLYEQSKDSTLILPLYQTDLDGAAAEVIDYYRLQLALKHPEQVFPVLSEKEINKLASAFEIASDDPETDRQTIAILAASSNTKVAKNASLLLKLIGGAADPDNAQG